jgi:hypothetical protein
MKKLIFTVCGVLALGAVSTFAADVKKEAKHECHCKDKDHAKCDKCHEGEKECTCDHADGKKGDGHHHHDSDHGSDGKHS